MYRYNRDQQRVMTRRTMLSVPLARRGSVSIFLANRSGASWGGDPVFGRGRPARLPLRATCSRLCPRPCQLAGRRRAPPTSNSSASAVAPITGRAGTGIRSATIEELRSGFRRRPVPPRPRCPSSRRPRPRARPSPCSSRCTPLQRRRAAVPDDQVAADGHRRRRGVRPRSSAALHRRRARPSARPVLSLVDRRYRGSRRTGSRSSTS